MCIVIEKYLIPRVNDTLDSTHTLSSIYRTVKLVPLQDMLIQASVFYVSTRNIYYQSFGLRRYDCTMHKKLIQVHRVPMHKLWHTQ